MLLYYVMQLIVAARVSGRHNHRFQNCPLQVVLFPNASSELRDEEGTTLKSGSDPNQHCNFPSNKVSLST